MTAPRCECPLLAGYAEVQRLRGTGPGIGDLGGGRVVMVGLLRDRHGCPGPDRHGWCPWYIYTDPARGDRLTVRRKPRPLYRGEDEDEDEDGLYL